MPRNKKKPSLEKAQLHPRNKHQGRYDLKALSASSPELAPFITLNAYEDESIDFHDPDAVKMLNKALLKHHYGLDYWDIPPDYLCPPIPGRADYLHHLADLLGSSQRGKVPKGHRIRILDVGTGASCIYPILGNKEYGWSFIGSDIDSVSIASAKEIIEKNTSLNGKVDIRLQSNPENFFDGVLKKGELLDATLCNPPFHASLKDAQAGTLRKLKNLKGKEVDKAVLNFGGQNNELWCEGGEKVFVGNMIMQSRKYAQNCCWFSSLISKESNLKGLYTLLKKMNVADIKTLAMGQGNKISRILAWTYFTPAQQKIWAQARWR